MKNIKLVTTPNLDRLWLEELLFTPLVTLLARHAEALGARVCYPGKNEKMLAALERVLCDESMITDDDLLLPAPAYCTREALGRMLNGGAGMLSDSDCIFITDLTDLSFAETAAQQRRNHALMRAGVRIVGADTVFISEGAEIAPGARILPGCVICDGVKIGGGTTVGPYAYLRPGCEIGSGCRIGDFVELKNAQIDDGAKVSHLAYIGDATVGKRVNFSCGSITSNYDGAKKHRTVIGDDAFIGCNTNLVAPVTVGEGAYTAAGTTVTQDVPPHALAIGRVRAENKEGWALKRLGKK